jgi:hypothetical protein
MATRAQPRARHRSSVRRRTIAVAPADPRPARSRAATPAPASSGPTPPLSPIVLGHYPFVGPFPRWEMLEHRAGILAIVQRSAVHAPPYRPLWIAEADDLYAAMAKLHATAVIAPTQRRGPVAYAALYTEVVTAARRQIVTALRARYQLPAALPVAAQPGRSQRLDGSMTCVQDDEVGLCQPRNATLHNRVKAALCAWERCTVTNNESATDFQDLALWLREELQAFTRVLRHRRDPQRLRAAVERLRTALQRAEAAVHDPQQRYQLPREAQWDFVSVFAWVQEAKQHLKPFTPI